MEAAAKRSAARSRALPACQRVLSAGARKTITERVSFSGTVRVLGGIVSETLLAALIAPSMMIFQSTAVTEILLGRDAGWHVQRRSGGEIAPREIYRKLAAPTLCGVLMGLSAFAVSLPLLLWMSPVIAGLVLAVPLGLLTSRPRERLDGLRHPKTTIRLRSCFVRTNLLHLSASK